MRASFVKIKVVNGKSVPRLIAGSRLRILKKINHFSKEIINLHVVVADREELMRKRISSETRKKYLALNEEDIRRINIYSNRIEKLGSLLNKTREN